MYISEKCFLEQCRMWSRVVSLKQVEGGSFLLFQAKSLKKSLFNNLELLSTRGVRKRARYRRRKTKSGSDFNHCWKVEPFSRRERERESESGENLGN